MVNEALSKTEQGNKKAQWQMNIPVAVLLHICAFMI